MDNTLLIAITLVAMAAAGYIYIIYKKQGKEAAITEARKGAYKLMLIAEKKFGVDAQGVLKMQWVAQQLYHVVPVWAHFAIDEAGIYALLTDVYSHTKDWLDDGVVNNHVG